MTEKLSLHQEGVIPEKIPTVLIGNIRVQILSSYLVRLEVCDTLGFEDNPSFNIPNRKAIGPSKFSINIKSGNIYITTGKVEFEIPVMSKDLSGVRARYKSEISWKKVRDVARNIHDLPEPVNLPYLWALRDFPRLIPPEWGATAPPDSFDYDFLSGWGVSDTINDIFVFFPKASGYKAFLKDFIGLTGRIPMIPMAALGFIYSRYHPYSDQQIHELIEKFKIRKIPVDTFVVDTDWRVGASHGYEINEELFPDMEAFISRCHMQGVKLMFNDHPEPVDEPLSPEELKYREEGLGKLFKLGLDYWWFDRNWKKTLGEPAPGIKKEIWGMRLYTDMHSKLCPMERPMIMSNPPNFNNGVRDGAAGAVAHRYPIWWTGDTKAEWEYLKAGIENAVNEGILSLIPYLSEDLGGHFGKPSPELLIRFAQFGALSPVFRLHCTAGECRDPWEYGLEAERVVTNFIQLRIKLLPMLYSAMRETFETGLPLLKRCDIEFPEFAESSWPMQYMLGNDLLVAPAFTPGVYVKGQPEICSERLLWLPPGTWHDLWTGITVQGPKTVELKVPTWKMPIYARNGGIIISQPEIVSSSKQLWVSLNADIFVPKGNTESKRYLYEDDKETNSYLDDIFRKTELTVARESDFVEFAINPAQGKFEDRISSRNWNLRFHFPRGTRLVSVVINDSMVLPGSYQLINNSERPIFMPMISRQGVAAPDSADTVELNLNDIDICSELRIRLQVLEESLV